MDIGRGSGGQSASIPQADHTQPTSLLSVGLTRTDEGDCDTFSELEKNLEEKKETYPFRGAVLCH